MSEIREKLLGSSALRSRAIKVIGLSILLISAFAFSTAFISLIFGSQRNTPSDSINDAEYDDVVLTPIDFPWDINDFLQFLLDSGLDLDPEDLDALLDMLDQLRETEEGLVTIFDLPPVFVGDDAVALSSKLDGVLVVVDSGRTTKEQLSSTLDLLKDVNVIGCVLNNAPDRECLALQYGYY